MSDAAAIKSAFPYRIGSTTVIANPRGYPDALNPGFQDDLVVSLDQLSSQ